MNVFILVLLFLPLCWSADQYDLVFAGTCGSSGQSCQCPPSKLIPVRPNFFFITVDQQRKLRPDDGQAIHDFVNALPGRKAIRDNAVSFQQHYIAAAACSPSRATFYTGHYPSLHGVAQTDGVGKSNKDSEIHWLGEGVVPTLADYMVAAGYNVQYRGKWHVSHRDISIPGTETSILTVDTTTNKPIPAAELIYQHANLLAAYGFQGWIGNEPHGSSPVNTGMIRDPIYQQQVLDAIQMLESATDETRPFWLTASFVNPHDISVWPGLNTFQAIMADNTSVPMPNTPVTYNESTDLTKPKCQASFNKVWDLEIRTGPYQHWLNYSQSYYYFQNWVDKAIHTVVLRMKQSRFYNNTYTIFTADHGEMLLAHGGMRQKWAQAYEEAVHVEFMVHHPSLVAFNTSTDLFTSHIDIIPTVLGLAGFNCYNREIIRISLGQWHTEARALLGQDLSDIIRSNGQGVPTVCWNTSASIAEEKNIPVSLPNAVYFMTDDDITRGDIQRAANITPALSPNAVEMVITKYTNGKRYKYVMIHDHTVIPTTTSDSPKKIEAVQRLGNQNTNFEFYCLDDDPYEQTNLIFSFNCTTIPDPVNSQVCTYMDNLLLNQRRMKRLVPTFQNVDACPVLICGSLS